MNKLLLSALLLLAASVGRAQGTDAAPSAADAAGMRSEWLPSFTAVTVSAPVDIVFVGVPDTQAPKIEYDTHGSQTARFRFEVKDKVLRITERGDSRRSERTSVRVYYNALQSVALSDAAAVFEGTFTSTLLDLTVGGSASVEAALDVRDLCMDLSGRSTATLTGSVRYLTLTVSTGSVLARKLETMAARVNVTSSGTADLWVTDRLEAKTSTGGKISYRGEPAVLRGGTKFMGGDIRHVAE